MKKSKKMIVALALVVIMGFVSRESFFAYVDDWQIIKTPGLTNISTNAYMPYWDRDITYELSSLTGTCTYVAAKCVTDPADSLLYTIDNSLSGFLHSKPDSVTFRLNYSWFGEKSTVEATFKISIDNNSTNLINETLTATGSISN